MRLPARIEMAILLMIGFINLYMTRINLSVISVAMVKRNVSTVTKMGQSQCLTTNIVEENENNLNHINSTHNKTEEFQEVKTKILSCILFYFYYK